MARSWLTVSFFVCLHSLTSLRHFAVDCSTHPRDLCVANIHSETGVQETFFAAKKSSRSNQCSVQQIVVNNNETECCYCQSKEDNQIQPAAVLGCSDDISCCTAPTRVCVGRYCKNNELVNSTHTTVCIAPSNKTLARAALSLLQLFGWNRTLTVIDSLHQQASHTILASLPHITTTNLTAAVGLAKDSRYRILMLFHIGINSTAKLLCEAYRQELFYSSGYAWVIVGVDVDELLNTTSTDMLLSMNCTLDMIKTVLNYTLVVDLPMINATTRWDTLALFDGVTALIEAADTSCHINNTNITASIQQNIRNVSFNGLTGNVTFDQNGSRCGTVSLIVQYRSATPGNTIERHNVAIVEKSANQNFLIVYINNENISTIWPDGVPTDGTTLQVLSTIHNAVFITFVILFVALVLFGTLCLLFSTIFRNRRVVKLTSPMLNSIMVIGVIILGTGTLFYSVPIDSMSMIIPICLLRTASLVFGHDIPFGIALLKLFRIHQIFRNPNPQKKTIKDWHLLLALGAILTVEAVLFTVLQTLAFTVTAQYGPIINKEKAATSDREYFIFACGNPLPDYILLGVGVTIKFAMHTAAIVLAVCTRNIEVEAVNDAKEIKITVIISTVLIIIAGAMVVLLESYPNASAIGLGMCIYLECITFLGFIFIPKMVILWKDPTGSNVFKSSSNHTDHSIASLPPRQGTNKGKFRLASITKVTNTSAMLKESALADKTNSINVIGFK